MAIYTGPLKYFRRNEVISVYEVDGQMRVRVKNPLSRKTVLESPKFKNTRKYSNWMARASRIGSAVYNALPDDFREYWMYRAFVREAMQLLKSGMTDEETLAHLRNIYVEINYRRSESRELISPKKANKPTVQKRTDKKRDRRDFPVCGILCSRRAVSHIKNRARTKIPGWFELYHIVAARAA